MRRFPFLVALLLLGVSLGALTGCTRRRQTSSEHRDVNAPPRNALEASYRWAGKKTDLIGFNDRIQLRLRTRRNGLKVLDKNLQAVGYVRHQKDIVLLEGANQKPLYLIEPMDKEALASAPGNISEGYRVSSVSPNLNDKVDEQGAVLDMLKRGTRLVELHQQTNGKAGWRLFYPGSKAEGQTPSLQVSKAEEGWKVEGLLLKGQGPVVIALAEGKGPRTLVATNAKKEVVLRVQSKDMPPEALLPVLDPALPSLVRAGLLSVLHKRHQGSKSLTP